MYIISLRRYIIVDPITVYRSVRNPHKPLALPLGELSPLGD